MFDSFKVYTIFTQESLKLTFINLLVKWEFYISW